MLCHSTLLAVGDTPFIVGQTPFIIGQTQSSEMIQAVSKYIFGAGAALLMNLLVALAIFFIGRWVARVLKGVLSKTLIRGKVDETLVKFLTNIAYALLMIVVILAALESLGVNTTSVAAILAAVGLAVGLALQSSLANFSAGVMLILFRPFKFGDLVEAGGTSGSVDEIHIFNTVMHTGDNKRVIVPNGAIISSTITNFSAMDTRRIDLGVGCGYGDDLKAVKTLLCELIAADDRILAEPEPLVAVNELGDSSVNFVVRPWVKSEDYWSTRRDLVERIKLGFDERGFSIPYPSHDVHIHNAP